MDTNSYNGTIHLNTFVPKVYTHPLGIPAMCSNPNNIIGCNHPAVMCHYKTNTTLVGAKLNTSPSKNNQITNAIPFGFYDLKFSHYTLALEASNKWYKVLSKFSQPYKRLLVY